MQPLTITAFARSFGLSRATLLYYDRIGLLSPSKSAATGYRLYGAAEQQRMQSINMYRKAGLSLKEIQDILDGERSGALEEALENRLFKLNSEIEELRVQQQLIGKLLKRHQHSPCYRNLNVKQWVAMLEEAGVDEQGRKLWHQAFERDAPEAHQQFLVSLGLSEKEINQIRRRSRQK